MTDDQLDLFAAPRTRGHKVRRRSDWTFARREPAMPFAMRDEIADAHERDEPWKVREIHARGVEVIRSTLL